MSETILRLHGIVRRFHSGDEMLTILNGADLSLRPGEIVALVAPSGTGKSTLLHLAGLLEAPQEGEVLIDGNATKHLSDTGRTALRRDRIGFVYQFHHLLAEFTARENVVLPQLIAGVSRKDAEARADDLLKRFGLGHRLHALPGKLSGGEQQRTAIARALANRPRLLLADEPTGNLDIHTSDIVFEELLRIVREEGVAALIATHNDALAARMDRILTLRDGVVVPV
ncbi:lipoprotein releasing system ATP-binding protein LolD [Neoasaia chiangmaiensis NBRC 101099]|uniref:ABC transporter n=1 Tax=Neoasaia chiangmaiensis TaxID=320497 RepID=A0A1U9KMQ2_9PROT|nr:ABC transporter ATP-binding protein [Neoasaia chiangmaiensis]AQS87066.1 ABC transporter [Neoasaia chiangmaiensis]GBR37959.1 lipoprotein releasing system ATP-binding protein LolD [Neoasaia chiangmaiensis NBRC 101099]GEN15208.1 lipoprotein-releasing system ATP-binding protein LolD 1 [Neoasaia chiangmaiensis]